MKGKKISVKERQAKVEQDKNERRRIFKELCTHIANGYSLDCFGPLGFDSIKKYLKVYPEEFVQEELDNAVREGKNYWETLGRRQSDGTCMGNSRSWYYNMVNRFNWHEKAQIETEHKGQVNVSIVSYATKKDSTDTQEQ